LASYAVRRRAKAEATTSKAVRARSGLSSVPGPPEFGAAVGSVSASATMMMPLPISFILRATGAAISVSRFVPAARWGRVRGYLNLKPTTQFKAPTGAWSARQGESWAIPEGGSMAQPHWSGHGPSRL